jgi:hypothetical protein
MRSPRHFITALWLAFSITLLSVSAWAQSATTGALSGTVTDAAGAVIPGATITLTNTATGASRTVTSDAEGRWKAPALDIAIYRLTVEANGFKKGNLENIAIEAAVPRTIELRLEAGGVNESVNITATTETIQTETATNFRQINAEELTKVPTSTRSFTHLLSAEAGISSDLPPVLTNGTGNISPSVNGTRTTSTSLTFNGIDATNLTSNEGSLSDNVSPAPETLEEVKLQTSLYDASTGRSGGGNFQLITKSGGNRWAGSAYHYLQHDKLNANDFFFNKDGIERPKARRNEGGFTIGGPVAQDKLFFFGGYQFTRANTGFVPTASSITVLPEALGLIPGERTAANIVAAFKSLNPNFTLTEAQIAPVTLRLLNIRNPATGGFLLASPRANAEKLFSGTSRVLDATNGNPLVRQRNVFPASFEQDQFTSRMDWQVNSNNRLSGILFFANFPGFDPFPDPSSLASPVTLQRDDRNRTFSLSDVQTFGSGLVNEARFGYFELNNTRSLTDEFAAITSESVGIPNPANFFDSSAGTKRLGHYVWRNNLSNLSFGGPNDSFNRRFQQSLSFSDHVTMVKGAQTLKFGAEFKQHKFDTNLPEEQATEFEKFNDFTQFLRGLATEADTQFGITDKSFRMRDLSWYAATDWKVNNKLTMNLGVRHEWFGWPEEKDGRIGNIDFSLINNIENPTNAFIVPSNVKTTGFAAIDGAIAASTKVNNKHTLRGQDWNNIAPRFGFAWTPFDNRKLVLRGGYGIFYDRPSAAFINTVFSNYPFLREIEVTAPSNALPIATAYSQQDPTLPFNRWLPFRVVYQSNGTYVIRDGTPVTKDAAGGNNPIELATGQIATGNVAETFEFRAVDRNLRTPYIQQWNFGFQYELTSNLLLEARYVGTKGTKLLQATAFNQSWDLNDPNTPEAIFKRFNDSYNAAYQAELRRTGNANVLRGPLNSGTTERARGLGKAFGFANPYRIGGSASCTGATLNLPTNAPVDYNLAQPLTCSSAGVLGGGVLLPFEARVPVLGYNMPEAVLLQSSANSIYNALQLSLNQRMVKGLQYNLAYTWSKSLDNNSSDPGSTAGGGKPDVPNVGFVVQGNQSNLRQNRGVSDFDRSHRFSASFVYELPFGQSRWTKGWTVSGFAQLQTGLPFSIFAAEPEVANALQYTSLTRGSGGIHRLGFGRPNLKTTLDDLRQKGSDPTEQFFNASALGTAFGSFGNLGRNTLRALNQKRFDFGFAKSTMFTERVGLEFRWDVFNIFNNVNFAIPANDLQDASDFGSITNTVGGPRVMQFGLKLRF